MMHGTVTRRPLTRSEVMSRIRGRDTGPELALRRRLWAMGIRYRVNLRWEGICVDIAIPSKKMAVFIDGCFWHGCPAHGVRPKTNVEFWRTKLDGNMARDRSQTETLQAAGWTVIRLWEHEVERDPAGSAARTALALGGHPRST